VNDLHQKELLLKSILENTRAQTQAIEDDELELLETLITRREGIIRQVDKLDQEMARTTPGTSKEPTGPIKELLRQIITIDDANQELMEKSVQDMGKEVEAVKEELRTIRERRRQGESYVPEYGDYREEGVFFDTRE